jgi:FkbM family methyltransferase
MLRAWLRDRLRAQGYVWFRKPALPWGVDLQSDLARWFDLDAFGCVVDVGAHVGKLSREFARMCPNAQVHAFELVPATFEQLQRNVRGFDRIHAHGFGLSDESGSSRIAVEPDSQQNSLRNRVQGRTDAPTVPVELRRLDEVAPELGIDSIDLLKIDAEGFDLQVMKGASGLFEAGKVRAVLVEVDFGHSSIVHGNFGQIAAWLETWSLRPVAFYDTLVLQREGAPYLDYTNTLFVRESAPRH